MLYLYLSFILCLYYSDVLSSSSSSSSSSLSPSSFEYSIEAEHINNYHFNQYHQYYHNYLLSTGRTSSQHDNNSYDKVYNKYLPVDYDDIYEESIYIKVDHDDINDNHDHNKIKKSKYNLNNNNKIIDDKYKLTVDYNNHGNHNAENENVKFKIYLKISYHNITNLNKILQNYIEFDVTTDNYKQIEKKKRYPDDKIQTIIIHFINDYQDYDHHHPFYHEDHHHNHPFNHSDSNNRDDFDLHQNQSHISPINNRNITTIIGTTVDEFLVLHPWWYIEKETDLYHISSHISHVKSTEKKPISHSHNDYTIVLQKYPLYEADMRY
jgi:hypothetical protein